MSKKDYSYNVEQLTNTSKLKAKTFTLIFDGQPQTDDYFIKLFECDPRIIGVRPAQLEEVWYDVEPGLKVITRGPPIILPDNIVIFPRRHRGQKI